MVTRSAVAIYARISQDRSGEELGIRRQLADCRTEAARRGWTVAEEYVDDDLSAWSGKRRPAYDRMLDDIREGRRDALIVWHTDRLHRRLIQLEEFIDACTRAKVSLVSPSGEFDMVNGDGLVFLRMLGIMAAAESDTKRRRGKRKALEIAESGKPMMGGPRPFGFLADKVTHHPVEAPVVRELAARALAGESMTSLARWLQDSGITTVGGNPWRPQTVRNQLISPRMWGMRVHDGQIIGEASWDPIISAEDGERLRRLLLDPARRTNRTARTYLLSGLLRCGKCGSRLHSTPKNGVRRYGCSMGPGFTGCGGVFIYAEMLERFIADAVLYRLDSADMHRVVTGAPDEERVSQLADEMEAATRHMNELADMAGKREISPEEWRIARRPAQERLEAARREFARATRREAAMEYAGRGEELRQQWDDLPFDRAVAIVKAVLDHAVILPAPVPGRRGLDPDRVEAHWRV